MKCDCSHQNIIGFGIGSDLIFFSIFRYYTDLCCIGDLRDNLVFDTTSLIDSGLEPTSLHEERLRSIVLWYWVCIPVTCEHAITYKYSLYNLGAFRLIMRES